MRIIKSIKPDKLFVYSGTQRRINQTAKAIIQTLIEKKLIVPNSEHISFDERLNGRDYGSLEGMNEQDLRRKKNLILKQQKH